MPKMEYETAMVAEKPSDLLKCDILQLRLACKEYGIIPDGDKWNLIGKLLHLFPAEAVTEEDLHRFKTEELRNICDGLNISREGNLELIADRIVYYHNKILIHSKSPNKKKTKMKKLISKAFNEIVPALPATVCNQFYRISPHIIPSNPNQDNYEWKKHTTQEILIGDVPFRVNVQLSVNLEIDENYKTNEKAYESNEHSLEVKKEEEEDSDRKSKRMTRQTVQPPPREKRHREDEREVQRKKKR